MLILKNRARNMQVIRTFCMMHGGLIVIGETPAMELDPFVVVGAD